MEVEAKADKDKTWQGAHTRSTRGAKTRKGVMRTTASAGVGKHKRGRNGGGAKGLTREYPDLSANKNENISPTFVLEEK